LALDFSIGCVGIFSGAGKSYAGWPIILLLIICLLGSSFFTYFGIKRLETVDVI
jgi:hypothetical protein